MSPYSYSCYFMVSKAMCELPQGLHDSLSVFIFQITASDEEACSIITGSSTATLCEIHVTGATGKLNMSPREVNIPLLYKCNLVWCVCHDALPVREEIIHRDWTLKGQRRASPLCCPVVPSVREWERHFVPVWAFPFGINNTVTNHNGYNFMWLTWPRYQFPLPFSLFGTHLFDQ